MAFASDDSLVKVKVIGISQISPPPASVPTTSLPLTFFDVFWLVFPPVKRLFFFQYDHSYRHFNQTDLPNIKHSLSLALQHFYPFAGNVRWRSDGLDSDNDDNKPEIIYADGNYVTLTVAESECGDFDYLTSNQPRNARYCNALVPALEPKSADTSVSPLMALQVTLFPNSGICIGVTISHVVADGRITTHFIKFWASICRCGGGGDQTTVELSSLLPFYDRTVIKDPMGLLNYRLNQLRDYKKALEVAKSAIFASPSNDDKVRATFVMDRTEIERLKKWVLLKLNEKNRETSGVMFQLSSFVVTCAYVFTCSVKSRNSSDDDEVGNLRSNKEKAAGKECFLFAVDCRERLDPPIPKMYFGNCLLCGFVEFDKSDITGDEGVATVAEAIGRDVQRMNEESVMKTAENFVTVVSNKLASGVRAVSVAGSPRFKVYETDFGWGRPKKVEVVSIEDFGAISLCEGRDGDGGIEVGLVLSKTEMDAFASIFEDGLRALA